MRLRVRLGLNFGILVIAMPAVLVGFLYLEVRRTFLRSSAEQASLLAELAVRQGEERTRELTKTLAALAADVQVAVLIHDAKRTGAAQKKLIDLLAARKAESQLDELTAIAPDGTILARGHDTARFGDRADSIPPDVFYFAGGSTMLKRRQTVRIRNRQIGEVEGGMELSEFLSDMGARFSGRVALSEPGGSMTGQSDAAAFQFSTVKPWRLPDGAVLANLVFSRSDDSSRAMFRRLIFQSGLIVVIVLSAAGFALVRISDTVTRPVRILARAASEFSRGNRRVPMPPPSADEVGELTAAFSRMVATLDESQKKLLSAERLAAWQDAARMLAHEIKNPLSPIKTMASTLARAAQDKDEHLAELAGRGASTILNEISHLEKLLAEFSSFARFPTPNPVPADFNSAVRAAVDGFRGKAKDVQWVERYAERLPPAMVDAGMFGEVVRNLLLNAVESAARRIHLETSMENAHAILTLADDGPGIAADKRATLFTPYFTTKPGGTGLGLAVSRKIMIEHGGDLNLLDDSPFPDAPGAAFRATLPLAGARDAGTWGAGGADPAGVGDADSWGAADSGGRGADPVKTP